MDKPDVFMPLFIGDYMAGTSRLTTEQHGAYMLLIMDYWMNGAPPDDDRALAQITRMTPDAWSNARAVLEKYFNIAQGVWTHKRVEEELIKAYAKKQAAKEKAERAAAARWKDKQKNAPSIASSTAQEKLEECPSPSPSPSPSPGNNKSLGADDVDAGQGEKKPKRRTRLPIDFALTDDLRSRAVRYWRSRDRPDLDPDHEFDAFCASHRGKGTVMADWDAAWQTWYTNAPKFNKPPARAAPQTPTFERLTDRSWADGIKTG